MFLFCVSSTEQNDNDYHEKGFRVRSRVESDDCRVHDQESYIKDSDSE